MGDFTKVTIDFQQSHLVFPTLIAFVLGFLGVAILIRDRARIAGAGTFWRDTLFQMDKLSFFGTLALTLAYFSLMVPIGNIWPNTGMGFLICSIPFLLLIGLLYMHERSVRALVPLVIVAVVAPTFVWWLFTYPFFLTLP